jgi:hypothetical protein
MPETPKVSAKNNSGLKDDHDPNDLGQKLAGTPKQQQSQLEGPAAYAPHDESEKGPEAQREEGEAAYPDRDPAKKKTGEF